ncbi:hypothetical protein [Rhodanobacter hydrolyticus]|uniref:Uncharacterized protein n=1 Tax=Rhodanobacter hydrolyticus TaxID=2250595 RepID=A0ABW8J368_9GAMM
MATTKPWSLTLLLAFSLASAGAQATSPNVATRVTIHSYWDGLSPQSPLKTELLIQRTAHGYVLSGASSHGNNFDSETKPTVETYRSRTVPAEAVERLVAALRAPPQVEVSLASLGASKHDMHAALGFVAHEYAQYETTPTSRARFAALLESLRQPETLAVTLTRGFAGFHTDDAPRLSVEVELTDHTILSAQSNSQHYRMLPWTTRNGESTYAPAIANALHALMPGAATNRERLSGPIDLVELIRAGLSEPLDRIDAETMAGAAMQALSSHFRVSQATYFEADENHGAQLEVKLQHPGSPDNLTLYVWLPLHGDGLAHAEDTRARLDAELSLVEATPSVMRRVRAAPHTLFVINDRNDVRVPYRNIAAQFVAQMHAMHKLPGLERDGAWAQGAVLLDEGDLPIRWIILPDHRAVLWKRYSGAPATPGTMRCASEPDAKGNVVETELSNLCEGIVYDTDGTLKH